MTAEQAAKNAATSARVRKEAVCAKRHLIIAALCFATALPITSFSYGSLNRSLSWGSAVWSSLLLLSCFGTGLYWGMSLQYVKYCREQVKKLVMVEKFHQEMPEPPPEDRELLTRKAWFAEVDKRKREADRAYKAKSRVCPCGHKYSEHVFLYPPPASLCLSVEGSYCYCPQFLWNGEPFIPVDKIIPT